MFWLADILNLVCKQAAWKCSLLLRKWCEGPSRSLAFLPGVVAMVSPWGQAGWLEPAKWDLSARANGYAGKDNFQSIVTCQVQPYLGYQLEYPKCGSASFPADSECRKIVNLASGSYLRVLMHSRKDAVTAIININFWVLFWRHFYKMSVTPCLFLSIDLATVPLFD